MRLAALALSIFAAAPVEAAAQTIDLTNNVQIHGFATQSFLYTTNNTWATTHSSDGSAAWTEAVVNVTAQPESKLRIGVQARYFLLGDLGNTVTLDWAQADYKFSEWLGTRVGKVKVPVGLFNEIQDIDPAYLWVLLPQSIYPLPSRNAILANNGGLVYGTVALGERFGKLEYRGFGGQRVVSGNDGYLQSTRDAGFTLPGGVSGPNFGGSLRWNTPLKSLFFGASETAGDVHGEIDAGPYKGTLSTPQQRQTFYFAHYEPKRFMIAGEFSRTLVLSSILLPGAPASNVPVDFKAFYGMTSYRATDKLSAGLYYSSIINTKFLTSSGRYQKDWALAARYDFNPSLYAKVEQHWMDGTLVNYSAADPNLQPNTRMTLIKLGVSF